VLSFIEVRAQRGVGFSRHFSCSSYLAPIVEEYGIGPRHQLPGLMYLSSGKDDFFTDLQSSENYQTEKPRAAISVGLPTLGFQTSFLVHTPYLLRTADNLIIY